MLITEFDLFNICWQLQVAKYSIFSWWTFGELFVNIYPVNFIVKGDIYVRNSRIHR